MTARAARLLDLANGLPSSLRLEVTEAIAEADRLHELGDSSAMRWLPEQIAYFARRHPEHMLELRRIYMAALIGKSRD